MVIWGPLSFGILCTSLCWFLHVCTTRTLPHICTDCAVHRTTIMTACSHTNGLVPWARHHRHAEARKNEPCGYGGLSTLQYNLHSISLSLTHSTLSFKYKLFLVKGVVFVLWFWAAACTFYCMCWHKYDLVWVLSIFIAKTFHVSLWGYHSKDHF